MAQHTSWMRIRRRYGYEWIWMYFAVWHVSRCEISSPMRCNLWREWWPQLLYIMKDNVCQVLPRTKELYQFVCLFSSREKLKITYGTSILITTTHSHPTKHCLQPPPLYSYNYRCHPRRQHRTHSPRFHIGLSNLRLSPSSQSRRTHGSRPLHCRTIRRGPNICCGLFWVCTLGGMSAEVTMSASWRHKANFSLCTCMWDLGWCYSVYLMAVLPSKASLLLVCRGVSYTAGM